MQPWPTFSSSASAHSLSSRPTDNRPDRLSVPPLRDQCVPSFSRFVLVSLLPPSSRRDRRQTRDFGRPFVPVVTIFYFIPPRILGSLGTWPWFYCDPNLPCSNSRVDYTSTLQHGGRTRWSSSWDNG